MQIKKLVKSPNDTRVDTCREDSDRLTVILADELLFSAKSLIVSDVISLSISFVDIKCDYSFSYLDQKELNGIKIKMKLHAFFVSLQNG